MRIDFYLLQTEGLEARNLFACRLIEKAYLRGHRLYVQCESEQQAQAMDDLLWGFKADSFIPHNLQGEGPIPPPPVQLGFGERPASFNDILLNLSDTVPEFFKHFKRVIEIVGNSEDFKSLSREHYSLYRRQGFGVNTHPIS